MSATIPSITEKQKRQFPSIEGFVYDTGGWNKTTEQTICTLEMVYSHMNHEDIWADFHPHPYYTIPQLGKRIRTELRKYLEAKFWYRGQAEHLGTLFGKYAGVPAIIIGSGPSLNKVLPRLHEWRGVIMCNSSQASSLCYHGADPTFIDIVDPRVGDEELDAPFNLKKTSLIINPGIHPHVMDRWRGRKYYFRVYEPTYDFYSKMMLRVYGLMIPTYSFPFGSSLSNSLSHAFKLGCEPIFLVGADLGCPGWIARFTSHIRQPRISIPLRKEIKDKRGFTVREAKRINIGKKWVENPPAPMHPDDPNEGAKIFIGENGVPTQAIHAIYRTQLMRVVAVDMPQVINASEGIILDDMMPKVPPLYPIEHQDRGFTDLFEKPEVIRLRAERHLHKHQMYLIAVTSEDGTRATQMLGMSDWRKQLRDMVNIIEKQGHCKVDYDETYKHLEEVERGVASQYD